MVSNMFFIFPYIGNNDPNWRTPSCFRGVGRYTTNQYIYILYLYYHILPILGYVKGLHSYMFQRGRWLNHQPERIETQRLCDWVFHMDPGTARKTPQVRIAWHVPVSSNWCAARSSRPRKAGGSQKGSQKGDDGRWGTGECCIIVNNTW